jgi:cellulose biosynthesis protein BcsQ
MALKQAKVVTITSVKGGTGKTTLALSLAGLLSLRKKKILLIDTDLYGSAIGLSSGVDTEKTIFTLVDDLKNNRFSSDKEYASAYNEYLSILPAPKDPRQANKINGKYITIILDKLKTKYDYIILDTKYALDEFNLITLDASDEIFYVIHNDPVDLKNMRTMLSIFDDIDKQNYKIILNEATRNGKTYLTNYDVKHMVNDKIDYIIPKSFYIKNIDNYILNGKIIALDSKIRAKYKKGFKVLENIIDFLEKEE